MKKYFILLLPICCIFACNQRVDNTYGNMEIQAILNDFFSKYEENGEDALDELFNTNVWIMQNFQEREYVKDQLEDELRYLGRFCGYDYICRRSVTNSFELYSFLVKYEVKPLRFTFIFYKASKKWALFSFQYDSDFISELEEAKKVYLLDINFNN